MTLYLCAVGTFGLTGYFHGLGNFLCSMRYFISSCDGEGSRTSRFPRCGDTALLLAFGKGDNGLITLESLSLLNQSLFSTFIVTGRAFMSLDRRAPHKYLNSAKGGANQY